MLYTSLIVVPRTQCSDAAEHIRLPGWGEAAQSDCIATLLGHALGHYTFIANSMFYFN